MPLKYLISETVDDLHDQILELFRTVAIVALPDLELECDLHTLIHQAVSSTYEAGLRDGGSLRLNSLAS